MKKKCSNLSKIIIAVVAVAIVVIGASVFSLRPKGELAEYTGILTGSSLYNNWEFGGKTLDMTGQETVWQKENPKRVPLVFKTEPNKDDFGKIVRVWGRINYYTPKDKREMTPKNAPYLNVERYEVMSDINIKNFFTKKREEFKTKYNCNENDHWIAGGGGSWTANNSEILFNIKMKNNIEINPQPVVEMLYNGITGDLIKNDSTIDMPIPCE